jgi:hypothetical protein
MSIGRNLRMELKYSSCPKCKKPNPPGADECKWCGQKFGSATISLPILALGIIVVVGIFMVLSLGKMNGTINDTESHQRYRIVYAVTEKMDQRIDTWRIQSAIDTKKNRRRDEMYPVGNSSGERKTYIVTDKTLCGAKPGTGQFECKPNEIKEIPAWQIVPFEVTPFYREAANRDVIKTQKDSAMIMGKNCAVVRFESKSAGGATVISDQYYWEGILLKSERTTETSDNEKAIMSVVAEAEEIQENIYIPDSIFTIPR